MNNGGRHIGFSGTRENMTVAQVTTLTRMLSEAPAAVFHHGDCQGSDATGHFIAHSLGFKIVSHPPTNDKLRAFCERGPYWKPEYELREPEVYMSRNYTIVAECDWLIATPSTLDERTRSGTWTTIRKAQNEGKPVWLIGPDGVAITEPLPWLAAA